MFQVQYQLILQDDHMSMKEDVNIPSDKGVEYITIESEINSKSSQSENSKGKRKKASTGSRIDKGFDKVCIVLEKKNKLIEQQVDLEAFEKEKEAAKMKYLQR